MAAPITSGVDVVVVHAASRAVALEAVADMAALLEVVAEREVEERPAGGGELHRGRQPALDDGEVTRREVLIEVRHEAADLDAHRAHPAIQIDAGPGDGDHPEPVHSPRGLRVGAR